MSTRRPSWRDAIAPPKRKFIPSDIHVPDALDYRESREFVAYCEIVRSVLTETKQNIRSINRKLGERSRPSWTMDALDRVAELHPAYIDTFTLKGH